MDTQPIRVGVGSIDDGLQSESPCLKQRISIGLKLLHEGLPLPPSEVVSLGLRTEVAEARLDSIEAVGDLADRSRLHAQTLGFKLLLLFTKPAQKVGLILFPVRVNSGEELVHNPDAKISDARMGTAP